MKLLLHASIGLMLLLTLPGASWGAQTNEEKALAKESASINATAKTNAGAQTVINRLEKEFSVTGAQVQGLRDQKLGYGEISIVLSLASKMNGGVTDANIQQVMTLRQGPPVMGWGGIAGKLGMKLGATVSQVRTMNRETRREMTHDASSAQGQQERNMEQHREMTGSGEGAGMSGGEGMSHGKGR